MFAVHMLHVQNSVAMWLRQPGLALTVCLLLYREGATLSGRQCAYKVLDAAPALAATSL